jgi:hypothetical protein
MSLKTKVVRTTGDEPIFLVVDNWLSPASSLLGHLACLKGVKVVSKKSWALTDDFEAYFTFKGRLFIMDTPYVDVWVGLIGQPADEELFAEIDQHVQKFSAWLYLIAPLAIIRFFFVTSRAPRTLLEKSGVDVRKWFG